MLFGLFKLLSPLFKRFLQSRVTKRLLLALGLHLRGISCICDHNMLPHSSMMIIYEPVFLQNTLENDTIELAAFLLRIYMVLCSDVVWRPANVFHAFVVFLTSSGKALG
jgi:hypothetical protein